jgi:hypothetical protein
MKKEEVIEITEQYKKDYEMNKAEVMKREPQGTWKIAEFCSSTGIPCIAAYGFVYEEYPTEENYENLKRVVEFYHG